MENSEHDGEIREMIGPFVPIPEGFLGLTDEEQQKRDFIKFNYKALKRMPDIELAALKCQFEEGVPQRVLIEHEFKKREGKPARIIAIIGILVTIFIAALTLYFKLK